MKVNFDIDEFIAYLLNGGLFIGAFLYIFPDTQATRLLLDEQRTAPQYELVILVGVAAAALVAGHVSSMASRFIVRRATWWLLGRPREAPFSAKIGQFWTEEVCLALQRRFEEEFGSKLVYGPSRDQMKTLAPRMIRTSVIGRNSSIMSIRERIVRARSFCANSVLPLAVFAVGLIVEQNFVVGGVVLIIALLMVVKQHDLDVREWKEIYVGFLVTASSDEEKVQKGSAAPSS